MSQFRISHKDGDGSGGYFPLSYAEVCVLLGIAWMAEQTEVGGCIIVNDVHIRLCQGIPGMTAIPPIDGPVSDKDSALSHVYVHDFLDNVKVVKFEDIPKFAKRPCQIMQS